MVQRTRKSYSKEKECHTVICNWSILHRKLSHHWESCITKHYFYYCILATVVMLFKTIWVQGHSGKNIKNKPCIHLRKYNVKQKRACNPIVRLDHLEGSLVGSRLRTDFLGQIKAVWKLNQVYSSVLWMSILMNKTPFWDMTYIIVC